ncbi:MAG: anaerobic ribonucleoside-triphosphate reductase, partial [Cetobacterium sp.]
CGNNDSTKMNVIRRVCGYLAQPDSRPFNKGKQKEVINRVKHM